MITNSEGLKAFSEPFLYSNFLLLYAIEEKSNAFQQFSGQSIKMEQEYVAVQENYWKHETFVANSSNETLGNKSQKILVQHALFWAYSWIGPKGEHGTVLPWLGPWKWPSWTKEMRTEHKVTRVREWKKCSTINDFQMPKL